MISLHAGLGKWKMVVQCAAIVSSLLWLAGTNIPSLQLITQVLIWAAVLITIASGADYVIQAVKISQQSSSQDKPNNESTDET